MGSKVIISGLHTLHDIGRMIFAENQARSSIRCRKTIPEICLSCEGVGLLDNKNCETCISCGGYGWVCMNCRENSKKCDCGNTLELPRDLETTDNLKIVEKTK